MSKRRTQRITVNGTKYIIDVDARASKDWAMARKVTKAELERQLLEVVPLREYFYARENNDHVYTVKSSQPIDKHREPYVVKYVGATRASGGVIVEACSVRMMSDWCHEAERRSDPYLCELAHKVRRLHSDALDEKYGKR